MTMRSPRSSGRSACPSRSPTSPSATGMRSSSAAATTASPRRPTSRGPASRVLVLERRERLGGACTLERPFDDERFVVSPCAYVVGLLDQLVIHELEPAAARACATGSPTRTCGCRSTTAPRSPSGSTTRNAAELRGLGVSDRTSMATGPTRSCSMRFASKLRKGERDTWVGEPRPAPRSRRCSAARRR